MPEYSVYGPATISHSASGISNGLMCSLPSMAANIVMPASAVTSIMGMLPTKLASSDMTSVPFVTATTNRLAMKLSSATRKSSTSRLAPMAPQGDPLAAGPSIVNNIDAISRYDAMMRL